MNEGPLPANAATYRTVGGVRRSGTKYHVHSHGLFWRRGKMSATARADPTSNIVRSRVSGPMKQA